jgi:hypothetical protein
MNILFLSFIWLSTSTVNSLLQLRLQTSTNEFHVSEVNSLLGPDQPQYVIGALQYHSQDCPYSIRNAIMISATLSSNVISQASISAHRCTKTVETWKRVSSPSSQLLWEFSNNHTVINAKACRHMAKHQVTTKNIPLRRLNATHYSTQTQMMMNNTFLQENSNASFSDVHYQLQRLNITFNHETGLLVSSDNSIIHNCHFAENMCYEDSSTLVWNTPQNTTCSTTKHQGTLCFLTPYQLVCPKLALMISDFQLAKDSTCGAHLGITRVIIASSATQSLPNPMDLTANYAISFKFHELYDHVQLGIPQHLHLFHTAACGTLPTKIHIPDHIRKQNLIHHPDAEYSGPLFFKEFAEFFSNTTSKPNYDSDELEESVFSISNIK